MEHEALLLWLAMGAYLVGGILATTGLALGVTAERTVLTLILAGLLPHTLSLGLRWARLGHGPFVSQFEIISSNLWSLLAFFAVVFWRFRPIRPLAGVVIPMMFLMMGWLLVTHNGDTLLPPTYNTLWLYIHIGLGKIFLGAALVAAALGIVILARMIPPWQSWFVRLPKDSSLDELSFRFMVLALIFDTMMLVAGAIWAQDAWGRYWNWDPLEAWSLINWLLIALALHLRPLFHLQARWNAIISVLVFMIAFLNFFGVPFLSRATHQGMV